MNFRLFALVLSSVTFCENVFAAGAFRPTAETVHTGDIVFHESQSGQSRALKEATGSRWTHMGLVLNQKGKLFVAEASSTVMLTPWETFIQRGAGGRYIVKRLKKLPRSKEPLQTTLERSLRRFQGKKYDIWFEWSDSLIYCSELVWKIYRESFGIEIGQLQKFRDFNLSSPAVQELIRKRFSQTGKRFNLDEPIVSPVAMFESDLLETVQDCDSVPCIQFNKSSQQNP
jgi:hypothetical protein